MADAAVEFLLSNLKELITEKVREIFVLEKEAIVKIKKIDDELQLLQSHFTDAGDGDEAGVYLRREVREMNYRFENLRENFSVVAASRGGILSRIVCTGLADLREVSRSINDIEQRIESLSDRRVRFFGNRITAGQGEGSSSAAFRRTYFDSERFVGRVEEIELLRSYLIDDDETSKRVISIFGMGGLGKTELAMKLFHDPNVRFCLEAVAWVSVSHRFQRIEILRDLYDQLVDPQGKQESSISKEMDEADLAQRVYKIQQERRCLIFLDDVWSSNAWQSLRIAFPSTGTRSKILITTRVMEVAETVEIVAAKRYIHKLRCLTDADGCDLLMKRLSRCGPEFEVNRIVSEIGKEVVKCCEGLPLAIISFIPFMVTKFTLEEGKNVHQNLESFVSVSQLYREIQEISQAFGLSYDNLPAFLKPCFLYLGYLQEHSQIETEKLYLFWVAEGLISQEDCGKEEILMNVAERYLNDLVRRSMVEVDEEEVPTITRFKTCLLNQLMRELSLSKCNEQQFFKNVDFGCGSPTYSHNQSNRLSINLDKYKNEYDFPIRDREKKEIRCLLLSVTENQPRLVWPKELSSLVKFKYLKVLDFMGFSFEVTKLPEGIGKLVFLRYLSFRGCIVPELPSSIGKLRFLYILDLRVINRMTIPNVLWKLKKLKHLYFPLSFGTRDDGKLRLDGLAELETVTNLNTTMFNVEDLLTLTNLHYVALSIPGGLDDIECIVKCMNINSDALLLSASIEVRNFDCYTEERHQLFRQLLGCRSLIVFCIEGHICRLPLHNEISPNLAKIVLIGSELMDDPMKTLEKLPKLRVLVLDNDAFVGEKMICSAMGFVELKRLELLNMQYLEKWIVDTTAMPKLSMLTIVNCGKLIMLPEELQFVRRLQKMNVSRTSKAFGDSVKIVDGMMRQDTYKDGMMRQHRPSIIFEDLTSLPN